MKKIKNLILFLTILIMVLNTPNILYSSRNQPEFDYNKNAQEKNVKSAYSPVSPITINGNSGWNTAALTETWCYGSGTWSDPYIIEDISVDGSNSSTCISISYSTAYFIIRHSLFTNAGITYSRYGIELFNVKNGTLINNDCSNDNSRGIRISNCNNITILNNKANSNYWTGMSVGGSTNNIISGNTVNNNNHDGIYLSGSSTENLVFNNTLLSNNKRGIRLTDSNNNTIFRNTASGCAYGMSVGSSHFNNISENYLSYNSGGIDIYNSNNNTIFKNIFRCNREDISEFSCVGNIIEENIYESCPRILGFDLYIIIGIMGIILIIISKKIKKYQ